MAINLSKGQSINLDKKTNDLARLSMGLGWDTRPPEAPQGGFFKRLFSGGGGGADFDLDGFAMLLNAAGKLVSENDLIYFGNLRGAEGHAQHSGDNLTGEGEGDDEVITLGLADMPARYARILVGVCIYKGKNRNQHFGLVNNAFVRAVDGNNKELARFNLSGGSEYGGKTSMLMGELVRAGDNWEFRALGQALAEEDINQVATKYS